jgi:prepilin-type N-terminal cleavage/methylation domain-containing protein
MHERPGSQRAAAPEGEPRPIDRGFSLIEMLIVIVLMGMLVTAVLVGIRVTVKASAIDRDHAAAFAWLQAGSDAVHNGPRVPCTSSGAGRVLAIATYDAIVRAVPPPPVWNGLGSIAVSDVEYLGRSGVDDDFSWSPSFCFEGGAFAESPLYTQRVTIRVIFPNGSSVQTLEMVKSQ